MGDSGNSSAGSLGSDFFIAASGVSLTAGRKYIPVRSTRVLPDRDVAAPDFGLEQVCARRVGYGLAAAVSGRFQSDDADGGSRSGERAAA
jgi:hypothetical protein